VFISGSGYGAQSYIELTVSPPLQVLSPATLWLY
jgi:hypothetical protein